MAKDKIELQIEEYGRVLFRAMTEGDEHASSFWSNIRAEAKPLVEQLIALNDKLEGGGYELVGMVSKGKVKLTRLQRIKEAQKKLWGVAARKVKEGDYVWLCENYDLEMYVGEDDPLPVDTVKKDYIIVDRHRDGMERVAGDEIVLLAPVDFDENEAKYGTDEYWLEQADKLGI
jgi:hypothetical protein